MIRYSMIGIAMLTVVACGEEKPPETPVASTSSTSAPPPAPSAVPATPATPASAASSPAAASVPLAPPAPKGRFTSFAVAANSGKVDKVGSKDGALTPDGVKDLVFEAELDGPAAAIALVSTDDKGEQNGAFSADTYVGGQTVPSEVSATLKQGKATAGIGVYEGDKLLNAKDGSLTPIAAGKHKLVLHVSSKDAPKGSYKAVAIFDDATTTASTPASVK